MLLTKLLKSQLKKIANKLITKHVIYSYFKRLKEDSHANNSKHEYKKKDYIGNGHEEETIKKSILCGYCN